MINWGISGCGRIAHRRMIPARTECRARCDAFMRELHYRDGIRHYQPTCDFTAIRKLGYRNRLDPRADALLSRRATSGI